MNIHKIDHQNDFILMHFNTGIQHDWFYIDIKRLRLRKKTYTCGSTAKHYKFSNRIIER